MVTWATWAELSPKLPNLDFITGARVQGLCLGWCPRPQPPMDLSEKVLPSILLYFILKSPETKHWEA